MEHHDWQVEERRIRHVIAEVNARMTEFHEQEDNVAAEMSELRRNFFNDVTLNFADASEAAETQASIKQQQELLAERERTYATVMKQQHVLEKLKHSPYFGRIDFKEQLDGQWVTEEPIYLGIGSLRDQSGEHYYVYDWRAPISSLYYDYPPGPAQYETPMGTIEGELTLKRQFVIRNGQLVSLFDTGTTIGDELLQEVLGQQSDAQMKSIVATIQQDQNRIIRNENKRLLVVQGAAGSGKTSAALQRVAYLLYRYRETLTADQIVLFSPNPMFNSYVSTVLPELGEENMVQTTFQDYVDTRLGKQFSMEGPYEQLEYALAATHDTNYAARMMAIRYKASAAFLQKTNDYIRELSDRGIIFAPIKFQDQIIFTPETIAAYFYQLSKAMSIPNRLMQTATWLLEQLHHMEKQWIDEPWVEQDVELLDQSIVDRVYQEQTSATTGVINTEGAFQKLAIYVIRHRLKPLRNRLKRLRFVHLAQMYKHLLEQVKCSPNAQSLWQNNVRLTLTTLRAGKILYEDATPFLYLADSVRGFRTNTGVRHILLDEAQDYTAFQFAYLRRLFPESRITALGDLNQSITAHTQTNENGLDTLLAMYAPEQKERIVLTRSYRSTKPIITFTSALLTGDVQIEPFNREGRRPTLTRTEQPTTHADAIAERVVSLTTNGAAFRNVAIICKSAAQSAAVHADLVKRGVHARLIDVATTTFEKGVVVIPSYLAKGVEFDAVIVYDASAEQYGHERERKLLYTVCTRAMHELHLFAHGAWSPFISEAAQALCEQEVVLSSV